MISNNGSIFDLEGRLQSWMHGAIPAVSIRWTKIGAKKIMPLTLFADRA
jgi:hypothetical protein